MLLNLSKSNVSIIFSFYFSFCSSSYPSSSPPLLPTLWPRLLPDCFPLPLFLKQPPMYFEFRSLQIQLWSDFPLLEFSVQNPALGLTFGFPLGSLCFIESPLYFLESLLCFLESNLCSIEFPLDSIELLVVSMAIVQFIMVCSQ